MITALSVDLALTNAGFALAEIPLVSRQINPSDVNVVATRLVETERQVTKQIRQNSDDLRRLREIVTVFRELEAKADIIFAEIPSGAQNARAATTFGAVLGILASRTKPLIEVQKDARGLVVAGRKLVSKQEVMDWAAEHWPNCGWSTRKAGGQSVLTLKNEHVADAIAITIAGTRTAQFGELVSMAALINARKAAA